MLGRRSRVDGTGREVFTGRRARKAIEAGDFQTIVQMLQDADPGVRRDTANACMTIDRAAPPFLVAALLGAAADPDSQVRGQAILALGSIRAPEGADVFLRALSEDEDDWSIPMFAATAIGWMPDPRAVEGLTRVLEHDDPLVRGAAAFALGSIGTSKCAAVLRARQEKERDSDVRALIEEALGKIEARS